MNTVFIDAGPLFALSTPRDQFYFITQTLLRKVKKKHMRLITTDDVVNEALTSIITMRKGGYPFTTKLMDWLFQSPTTVKLEWISRQRFIKALEIFRTYNKDKCWSFTDCTSYVVMKELKISTVFTFDDHFEQMGFYLLS